MSVEIKVPSVGESITEVQIGAWHAEQGKWVAQDSEIVELETDKATFDVPAPLDGIIVEILKKTGEMAAVGEVIGYLEEAERPADQAAPAPEKSPEKAAVAAPQAAAPAPAPTGGGSDDRVMPAAARVMAEKGLTPADITGTGPGGRILKEDVLAYQAPASSGNGAFREEEIVPMSPIRKKIAERLVEAQTNAALLTTFNEVDMSAVMELRAQYKDLFLKKYDVKLGFMSFFVKAVVDGLSQFPQINAEIRGTDLVFRNYYDIGIAVGGGKGLVVPVMRNAERLSFAEIELKINDFGQRARANKIGLDELQGGTFTITNGGVYGSLLSTPIVNPPQSGVLGMHGIQERPIAVNGQVVIRPMMYIALTYDHRVVDGREAVVFLKRVKEALEEPARMLMEI
ncbi:2-oxoglutarate dehydrogenase complex dihydrolipoyllysine-residue succinyltransferase [Gimesia panareensis]|uniref:Dihydrolipoyllysine-residue succinyltransferase component of 2-oxoglutarate dehydrogenase complex n=1 Tax=Gimesia panareensis TaxID=2527978 RepID=A0A517QBS3_9PLAN|nr:2-oxoglutarate dehydrogenase complex dihydrolipoyllysine-residue succinyltransferase [Gimesia panareensis]QDT29078.1 Dihydrolipoyllysine-residue succinyltransferase component of 2-oxoglutarate dehydrogenase complex [Gimesia panareensis]QDU51930.1 Dihydrolipoyllysine-residue succinyltransferase component of 2-oxoglutarate dehydrogenase complex [Gimesia panareensis]